MVKIKKLKTIKKKNNSIDLEREKNNANDNLNHSITNGPKNKKKISSKRTGQNKRCEENETS